jgi:circadian clock protein KaiB
MKRRKGVSTIKGMPLAPPVPKDYVLRLFVTGTTPRSTRSIINVRNFCDRFLEGHYELEVVDIYQQPMLARCEQIVAAPTLIKKLPLPMRRIIGDMSNRDRVLVGLDLLPLPDQSGGGTS